MESSMTFLENLNEKFFQDVENKDKNPLDNSVNLHYFLNNIQRLRYLSMNYDTNIFKQDSITEEYLDSIIELIRSQCLVEDVSTPRSRILNNTFNTLLNENPDPSIKNTSLSIFNNAGSLFVSYGKFFAKSYHIRLSRYV